MKMPFAGIMEFLVDADSEEEAIKKAELSEVTLDFKKIGKEHNNPEFLEWDLYRTLVKGNVVYAPLWDAEAEKLDE